ncbi:MAG: hypothetical protein QM613_04470 [Micrococcaceae bacterium]
MNDFLTDEHNNIEGTWFLQDNQARKVSGTLKYNDNSYALDLTGSLTSSNGGISSPNIVPSIWGETEEGQKITLFDCEIDDFHTIANIMNGKHREILNIGTVLFGAHIKDVDTLDFASCRISVENLQTWLSIPKNNAPGNPDFPIENDSNEVTIQGRKCKVTSITDGSVAFFPEENFSFQDAFIFTNFIRDLVTLARYRGNCRLMSLKLRLPEYGNKDNFEIGVWHEKIIDKNLSDKNSNELRFLFTCKDITFNEIIKNWSNLYEKAEVAISILLSTLYETPYLESGIATVSTAVEALHKALDIKEDKPHNETEFEEFKESLLQNLDEKWEKEEWIETINAMHNNPNFRTRLKRIPELLDKNIRKELIPKHKKWYSNTVYARNKIVHEGHPPNMSIQKLEAIFIVTHSLLVTVILGKLKIPTSRIQDAIRNNSRMISAVSQTAIFKNKKIKNPIVMLPADSTNN